MDLLIRYWNEEKMQVEVSYWDSSFMGHCTSHDLKNHFNERISDLNLNKILLIYIDGPSVNLKFHRDAQSSREELELPKLIDIGSCFYTQFMVHSKWELNQLTGKLRKLHDSPARRSDYTNINGSTVFSLSFCATRWVEDKKVTKRLISIWPSIVKIVNHKKSFPKTKRPSWKSYEFVIKAVKNELSLARLQFFNY